MLAMPLPPPNHGVLPVQTIRWIRNPFQVMADHQARYGDVFTIRLPAMPSPLVLVSDPDVVKEIFALGPDEGHAGKANAVLKPFWASTRCSCSMARSISGREK
jgi:cytochrome P450